MLNVIHLYMWMYMALGYIEESRANNYMYSRIYI